MRGLDTRARTRLMELPADPGQIRTLALDLLNDMNVADGACIVGVSSPDHGPPLRWGVATGIAKTVYERAIDPRTSQFVLNTVDVRLSRPADRKGFRTLAQLGDRDALLQSPAWTHLYEPARVNDQARVLLSRGTQITGLVSVMRGVGTPRFSASDARTLQPLVEPLRRAINAADALEREGLPDAPADLLLDPRGRVLFASVEAQTWMKIDGFTAHLAALVRSADRERSAPNTHGWARIALVRVHGQSGGVRYLAHITAAPPLHLAPAAALTPAQREVAALVAAGATLAEVALMTGRSLETVRSHVKAIYQRLDVETRAELTRTLDTL